MNRKCCSANLVFQNTTVMRRQRQKRTTRHGSGRGRTAATWPGRAKEAQIRDTVKCILSHKNHHHFVTSFCKIFATILIPIIAALNCTLGPGSQTQEVSTVGGKALLRQPICPSKHSRDHLHVTSAVVGGWGSGVAQKSDSSTLQPG